MDRLLTDTGSLGCEWIKMSIFDDSEYGRATEVLALLDAGVDVNKCNKRGDTPLHLASSFGHYEVVKILLRAGAGVNIRNKRGETSLHLASFFGFYEVVKMLIQSNADVNCKDKYGRTTLHLASMIRAQHVSKIEITRVLIENNADISVRNQWGETAEYVAIKESMDRSNLVRFREGARVTAECLRKEWEWPLRKRRSVYAWLLHSQTPLTAMRKGRKTRVFNAKIPIKPIRNNSKIQIRRVKK